MAQNSHNMAIFPHFLAFLVTFLVVRTTFMRLTSTERTQRPVTVLEQTLSRVDVPYGRPTRTDSICPAAQVLNCVENWNCVEKSWTTAIRSRPPQPSGLSTTATHWLLTTTTATYSDHGFSLRLWLVWYLDLDNYFCENDLWFVLQWKCYDYNDKRCLKTWNSTSRERPVILCFCFTSAAWTPLLCQSLLPLPPLGTTIITTTTTTTGLPSPSPPSSPPAPTSIRSLSTTWQISLIPANHFYDFFVVFFICLGMKFISSQFSLFVLNSWTLCRQDAVQKFSAKYSFKPS